MQKVLNSLGIQEAIPGIDSEDIVLNSIKALEMRERVAKLNLQIAHGNLKIKRDQLADINNQLANAMNRLKQAEQEAEKSRIDIAMFRIAHNNTKAKGALAEAVRTGKLPNETKVLNKWVRLAEENYTEFETLLSSLPSVRKSQAIKIANKEIKPQYPGIQYDLALIESRLNEHRPLAG